MRTILLTSALWLLATTAWGYTVPKMIPTAPISPTGSTLVQSSDLPLTLTLSDDDKIYYLSGNITTTGSALRFNNVERVRFNGNGDTIFFGSDDADNNYGLWLDGEGGLQDLHFQNVTFMHNPTDTSGDSTNTLLVGGGNRILFDTCWFTVYGQKDSTGGGDHDSAGSAHAIGIRNYTNPNSHSKMWRGGGVNAHIWGFVNRMNEDAMAVKLKHGNYVSPDDTSYHFIFVDFNVTGQGGMTIEGRTWVSACSITVDQQNLRYAYPSSDSYKGCANQAGLGSGELWAPTRWTNNYIVGGFDNQGLDEGIIISGSGTHAYSNRDSTIQIDSNYVRTNFRWDPYYGGGLRAKPFASRYGNWDCWIHNNTFLVWAGDTIADTPWGYNSWGVKYIAGDLNAGYKLDSNYIFENNYIEIIPKSATLPANSFWTGIFFSIADNMDSAEYNPDSAGVIFRNNHIKTPQYGYKFGGSDGGCQFMLSGPGDTIEFFTSDASIEKYVAVGLHGASGPGDYNFYNIIQDPVFTGTGKPDSTFRFVAYDDHSIGLKRTLALLVLDAGSNPVSSANVWAVNTYGDTVVNTTSDGSGLVSEIVKYYEDWTDVPDSFAYNDFTFGAAKAGDTGTSTLTVDWNAFTDTLILAATNIPPKRLRGVK